MGDLEVVLGGDDTIRRNFSKVEELYARVAALEAPAFVTTLPSSPFDGQVIYYDTGTEGIVWQLRYNADSASTYKWEFIGGAPLCHTVFTSETCAGDNTVRDLTTVGPTLTFPLDGDFDVEVTTGVSNGGAATATMTMIQMTDLANANFATPGNWFLQLWLTATTSERGRITGHLRLPGRTASSGVKMRYLSSATAVSYQQREMIVYPVRVG